MTNNSVYITPSEVIDVTIDWTQSYDDLPILEGSDTIVSSSWSYSNVAGDVTLNIAEHPSTIGSPATSTTAWIGGGTAGLVYTLTNTVTTANSPARVYTRSILVYVNSTNS